MSIQSLLGLVLLGLANLAVADLKPCGGAQFDPTQYVCWENEFLCPVIADEGLPHCSGTCYNKYMYECKNSVLALLPANTQAFTLTASNPTLPIHGWPVNAVDGRLIIGGQTTSYCPDTIVNPCPPGNVTVLETNNELRAAYMDVAVPGGQGAFLSPDSTVGYTQPHSAYVPPGSRIDAFGAYVGGGFVNLAGDGRPWVACPPPIHSDTQPWPLYARNSTNADQLFGCPAVNLVTQPLDARLGIPAWEYI